MSNLLISLIIIDNFQSSILLSNSDYTKVHYRRQSLDEDDKENHPSPSEVFSFYFNKIETLSFFSVVLNVSLFTDHTPMILTVKSINEKKEEIQIISKQQISWHINELIKKIYLPINKNISSYHFIFDSLPSYLNHSFISLERNTFTPFELSYHYANDVYIPTSLFMNYQLVSSHDGIEIDQLTGFIYIYDEKNVSYPIQIKATRVDGKEVSTSISYTSDTCQSSIIHIKSSTYTNTTSYSNLLTIKNADTGNIEHILSLDQSINEYDLCTPTTNFVIELSNATISYNITNAITVSIDSIPLNIASKIIQSFPFSLRFTTISPFSPIFEYSLFDSYNIASQMDPSTIQSWQSGSSIVVTSTTKAVIIKRTLNIPDVLPTLLVTGFYFQGGIEVFLNTERVGAFCIDNIFDGCYTKEIHHYFSYPLILLPTNTTINMYLKYYISDYDDEFHFQMYGYYDIENDVTVQQSYRVFRGQSINLNDQDVLIDDSYETTGSPVTFGYANEERVIGNYYAYFSYTPPNTIEIERKIDFYHEEFQTILNNRYLNSSVPTTMNLLDFYGSLNVDNITIDVRNINSDDSYPRIGVFSLVYKRVSTVCNSIDSFPSVPSGCYSAKPCGEYRWGFITRYCNNGLWDEPDDSLCYIKTPTLSYQQYQLTVYTNTFFEFPATVIGDVERFEISCFLGKGIPYGLYINETTGTIFGRIPDRVYQFCESTAVTKRGMGRYVFLMQVNNAICIDGYSTYSIGEDYVLPCGKNNEGQIVYHCIEDMHAPSGGRFVVDESKECKLPNVYRPHISSCHYIFFIINCGILILVVVFVIVDYRAVRRYLKSVYNM